MKTKLLLAVFSFLFSLQAFSQAPSWLWAKGIGGGSDDEGGGMTVDGFGNVYTTGWFNGTVDFDPGPGAFILTSTGLEDIFISKLDFSGNVQWTKNYNYIIKRFG